MNTGPREWDAKTYDRVSDPQYQWGLEVLDRLELKGDERVVDAGCGSGRVTAKLLERLPNGSVLCVDASESMIEQARETLGDRAEYLVADLAELETDRPVDVVFSTATFHWVTDHDRLFSRLHAAIRPGGRLHAQCGGEGNVAKHAQAIVSVASRPEFAPHFQDMTVMWNFASPGETEERLRRAGFDQARRSFAEAVLELEDDPLTLNYVRLNIEAVSSA
jgi:trans-aconitate 2-methyltransferase